MTDGFVVHVDRGERCYVMALTGELDLDSVSLLQAHVDGFLDNGEPTELTVDLSALTFIDSIGLHALVDADQAARRAGKRLQLVGASGLVRRVFEVAGLADRFEWLEPSDAA